MVIPNVYTALLLDMKLSIFTVSTYFIPTTPYTVGTLFYRGGMTHIECKRCAQCHPARKCQSWDLNPGS